MTHLDDRLRLALEAAAEMAESFSQRRPLSIALREQIWDDLEDELAHCRLSLGEALRLYQQEREAARLQSTAAFHEER